MNVPFAISMIIKNQSQFLLTENNKIYSSTQYIAQNIKNRTFFSTFSYI